MSALRILALSYIASASVFVMAATLVAHPRLARDIAAVAGGVARRIEESITKKLANDRGPVVQLTLATPRPNDVRIAPPPRAVQPPDLADVASSRDVILPDLS